MARFVVKADVSAAVEIEFEADDAEAAKAMFRDQIAMNAVLVETSRDDYVVNDDGIIDIERLSVTPA